MDTCYRFLNDIERSGFLDQEDECKMLINLAMIRLVLSGLCVVLHAVVSDSRRRPDCGKVERLLNKCIAVLERDQTHAKEMKLYLVRAMVKMFSRDLIKEWRASGKFTGIYMLYPKSQHLFRLAHQFIAALIVL